MPAMNPLSVERLKMKSSRPVRATDSRLRLRKASNCWVARNQNAGVTATAPVSNTTVGSRH